MFATSYRWVRPLALAAVAFVLTTAFQARPAPGLRGTHLGVTAALVAVTAGTVGMLRLAHRSPLVLAGLLVVVSVGAAALMGFQSGGPGFLVVFPAMAAAALRLPARLGRLVAAVAVAAVSVAWLIGGARVEGIVLNEFGVVGFFLLGALARRLREANEDSQRLIGELQASQAAAAQTAALAERQRLAREVHDVLAHSLSGLVLNLEGARLLAERGGADPAVGEAVDRAHRLAKTGLEEARRAIGMLRDDELPGPARLASLATDFERDSGVPCAFSVEGERRELDPDARLTVYRVAQEALTNIRKHARPSAVEVRLVYEPAGTRLVVEDVAAGGERPPPGDGTGYGLTGMRERAELLGGTLVAGPTDRGFRVELWVPA